MTGLNLMRLLVQNRIAEFHTELEVLPPEASACASCIRAYFITDGRCKRKSVCLYLSELPFICLRRLLVQRELLSSKRFRMPVFITRRVT